jgi:hypothetical protein
MARPTLPNAKDVVEIVRALKAEGVADYCIRTEPGGACSISVGQGDVSRTSTPLEIWKAENATS